MKISIETIPHDEQRYDTLGDYWDEPDGTKIIRVSAMPDKRHEQLIAFHELVETLLCDHRGIAERLVMTFDIENPDLEDPGSDPRAPYHREHMIAMSLERCMAAALGVDWDDYEAACRAVSP